MKKRDFTAAFENDNHIDTGLSLDEAVHGAAPKLDTGRIVARPISIFEIYPDPTQPRRAIPSSARQGWDGSPAGIESVLIAWHSAVEEESQRRFDLDAYLDVRNGQDADEDDNEERRIGPVEAEFRKLVDLVAAIYRDGLTNPITVAHMSNQSASTYRLETGERRWLAYHLLHANFPHDDQWTKILARIVDNPNVWRQASENSARNDLNAIGKARQYALLMMALYSERGEVFKPFDRFEHERHFYSQALILDAVPYGRRDQLLSAMALKSPAELTRCRALLGLPDAVWTLADDLNAPQSVLLECASLPEKTALQIVSSWNDLENTRAERDKRNVGRSEKKDIVEDTLIPGKDRQRIKKFLNLISTVRRDEVKHLSPEIQQQYLEMAEYFESLANNIRRSVEKRG
jgi:hypothetical protein